MVVGSLVSGRRKCLWDLAAIGLVILSGFAEARVLVSFKRHSAIMFLRQSRSNFDLESSVFSQASTIRSLSPDNEDKIHHRPLGLVSRTTLLVRKTLDVLWPTSSAGPPPTPARRHSSARRGSNLGTSVSVGALLAQTNSDQHDLIHTRRPSGLEQLSFNTSIGTSRTAGLIAPCSVPSASFKHQASKEEGILVPASITVGDCIDFMQKLSKLEKYKDASRSLERIFVTDRGRLVGYVTTLDLLCNTRVSLLSSLARPCEVVVQEADNYDDAIISMRQKGLTYAPVVDANRIVTGIITPSDMMDEMEIEATDDVMRFSGSGSGESYFGTSLFQLVSARAYWLISLLMLQSLSSIILTRFSTLIERHIVIALFLTAVTGTAGNAGNQSSAMVIRGLATGEINRKNGRRVIMREVKAAMLMSLLVAVASFLRVYITPGSTLMSTVAVTMAMCVTVIGACIMGTIAPLILDRIGLDPCNCASPFLATLVDVSGVLILCAISSALLARGKEKCPGRARQAPSVKFSITCMVWSFILLSTVDVVTLHKDARQSAATIQRPAGRHAEFQVTKELQIQVARVQQELGHQASVEDKRMAESDLASSELWLQCDVENLQRAQNT